MANTGVSSTVALRIGHLVVTADNHSSSEMWIDALTRVEIVTDVVTTIFDVYTDADQQYVHASYRSGQG